VTPLTPISAIPDFATLEEENSSCLTPNILTT